MKSCLVVVTEYDHTAQGATIPTSNKGTTLFQISKVGKIRACKLTPYRYSMSRVFSDSGTVIESEWEVS